MHADLLQLFAPVNEEFRVSANEPDLLVDAKAMRKFLMLKGEDRTTWEAKHNIVWIDFLQRMKHSVATKGDHAHAIPLSVVNSSHFLDDIDKALEQTWNDDDTFCQLDNATHLECMKEYTEHVVSAAGTAFDLAKKTGLPYRQLRSKIWLNSVVSSTAGTVPQPFLTRLCWLYIQRMLAVNQDAIREVSDSCMSFACIIARITWMPMCAKHLSLRTCCVS
jgi:hypothetical protein